MRLEKLKKLALLLSIVAAGCHYSWDDLSGEPEICAPSFVQITELSEQPTSPQLGRLVTLRMQGGLGLQLYSNDATLALASGQILLAQGCTLVDSDGDELLVTVQVENEAVVFANLYELDATEANDSDAGAEPCRGKLLASATQIIRVSQPNPPGDDAGTAAFGAEEQR